MVIVRSMERQALVEAAETAEKSGELAEAAVLYSALESDEPHEPEWPLRLADLRRALKDRPARIDALCRAALAFDASGRPLKGVATAKLALSLNPNRPETQSILGQLQRRERASKSQSEAGQPAALPPIPLFSHLSESAFANLLHKARLFETQPGEVIFEKGAASTSLYVIAEGAVNVFLDPEGASVSKLGAGEFFGEMGVFTKRPRGATIVTSEPSQILEMPKSVLDELIQEDKSIQKILLTFFGERLIQNVLRRAALFKDLGEEERESLRKRFFLKDIKAQTLLIEQGKTSPALFVLIDGLLHVKRKADGEKVLLAELSPGAMFGEVSIMTRLPAIASVTAPRKCLVLMLPAERFQEVAEAHPALLTHASRLADERMEAMVNDRTGYTADTPVLLT